MKLFSLGSIGIGGTLFSCLTDDGNGGGGDDDGGLSGTAAIHFCLAEVMGQFQMMASSSIFSCTKLLFWV